MNYEKQSQLNPKTDIRRGDRLVNAADRIFPWCASLVASDEEDLLVQFAHHSVKQFLLSKHYCTGRKRFHFQLHKIDHMAGEVCVTYLNVNDFKRQTIRPRKLIKLSNQKI
jgi:hypothetical protein